MSGEAANWEDLNWEDLEASLDGVFLARAKGFLGSEFSLSGAAGEFGSLRFEGPGGASFEAGGIEGRIESSGSSHRMIIGGEETLTAERDGSGLAVESGGVAFDADFSLIRNLVAARSEDSGNGGRSIKISGGMTNRRYEVSFEGEGSLPVAVFLLARLASLRRRAFRAAATNVNVK